MKDSTIINFCVGAAVTTKTHPNQRKFFENLANAKNQQSLAFISDRAKIAVVAKLVKDPKQAAKEFVKYCWLVWQEEPEKYGSKAAFARVMLKEKACSSLTNTEVISKWCRTWEVNPPIL